jgi:hypothetical protein
MNRWYTCTVEKNSENEFIPRKWSNRQPMAMVPLESAPQELSNEWSCQYVSIIFNHLDKFCVPLLVREVTSYWTWIPHHTIVSITALEPRSMTTSVTRPTRHDDQISPVPNGFLFNFHFNWPSLTRPPQYPDHDHWLGRSQTTNSPL